MIIAKSMFDMFFKPEGKSRNKESEPKLERK